MQQILYNYMQSSYLYNFLFKTFLTCFGQPPSCTFIKNSVPRQVFSCDGQNHSVIQSDIYIEFVKRALCAENIQRYYYSMSDVPFQTFSPNCKFTPFCTTGEKRSQP